MRTWQPVEEPDDVYFVEDVDGDLWQRCRTEGWTMVQRLRKVPPHVGERTWGTLLGDYGPLTEVEADSD